MARHKKEAYMNHLERINTTWPSYHSYSLENQEYLEKHKIKNRCIQWIPWVVHPRVSS